MRQWVLSMPFPLRFLFASQLKIMGKALGIVYRTIATHLPRYLEHQGLLERDVEHSTLALDDSDEDPMDQLRGHSITYRIAVGPQQGRKVFTLQTLPGIENPLVIMTFIRSLLMPAPARSCQQLNGHSYHWPF